MTETFVLAALLSPVFLLGLIAWSFTWRQRIIGKFPLVASITAIALALSLILLSTSLISEPILNLGVAAIVTKAAPALIVLLLFGIGLGASYWFSSRIQGQKNQNRLLDYSSALLLIISMISFAALLTINGWQGEVEESIEQDNNIEDSDEENIPQLETAAQSLPQGFELHPILPGGTLEKPVAMTAGDNGTLFFSLFDGGIYQIDPSWLSGDIQVKPYAPELPQITGMVYFEGSLFANGSGNLYQLTDTDNDGLADAEQVLIEGLPSRVYDHHSNNGLIRDEVGLFYFGLGGTTDHGPETDELAGNILVYDPVSEVLSIFAHGFRNPYDLVFCPSHGGELFATDNSPDRLDERLRFVPPDELNLVQQGLNYGYPDFFGYPPPWSDTESPIALMETAGVPAGLICYEGEDFPVQYQNNLFIALAGGSNPATGHKIVRVEIDDQGGQKTGKVTDFLTGLGRPVDMIEYSDGSLLILDYDLGQIYQVVYVGD